MTEKLMKEFPVNYTEEAQYPDISNALKLFS